MVDVSHNSDDRRTRNKIFEFFDVVDFELRSERIFERYVGFVFEFDSEFVGNEFRSGKIDAVVYGFHNTEHEKRLDDFRCGFTDFSLKVLIETGSVVITAFSMITVALFPPPLFLLTL